MAKGSEKFFGMNFFEFVDEAEKYLSHICYSDEYYMGFRSIVENLLPHFPDDACLNNLQLNRLIGLVRILAKKKVSDNRNLNNEQLLFLEAASIANASNLSCRNCLRSTDLSTCQYSDPEFHVSVESLVRPSSDEVE